MDEAYNKLAGIIIGLVLLGGVAVWGGFYLSQAPRPKFTSDNIGSTLGGRMFVIGGDGFMPYGETKVLVDGHEATEVKAVSSHSVLARPPQGSDGPKDVVVINPNGKRGVLRYGYVYSRFKPDISSVDPAVLPAAGGILVTIHGAGFNQGPIRVRLFTSNIKFSIINDSTITFIAPPAPHPVPTGSNLEVETIDGQWTSDEFGLNYR